MNCARPMAARLITSNPFMLLFKQQNVSVEELSTDSYPMEMFLKQIFAQEAKLREQIC